MLERVDVPEVAQKLPSISNEFRAANRILVRNGFVLLIRRFPVDGIIAIVVGCGSGPTAGIKRG